MAPEVVKTDLTTFKACLKLIQDTKSDTIKIAKQIIILENLSIVKSMILVSELLLLCIVSSSYHYLFFFSNITLLCIVLLLFCVIFFFSTIQVKKDNAKSQWEDDSIITKAAAPIQELMEKPPVVAARKFVEEGLSMTFSMGDSQSKSLEDIKSLCVASYVSCSWKGS